MKKMPKKDENESIPDDPSYRVVSVSLPKPDRRAEDLTASTTPYYRQHNIMTPKMQSQGIISATLDQNHHRILSFPQGKQDASVEARISLVGIEAMTQTDDATLAEEPTGKARDDDGSPSERTYDERLKSLSKELSEIRSLLERVRSK
jgi:hypothetical protein